MRAEKDLWFTAAAVGEARERLLAALAADGEVTLAGFRDTLACGRRNAIASRGGWSVQGDWVWRWKNWIDRAFVRRFDPLADQD